MADSDTLAVVGHPEGKPLARGTSPSFCVRLWQHMRIDAGGEARVCCTYQGKFVENNGVAVSTDRESLMEIWNSDTMRELRRAMVEGRRIAGCQPCYAAEASGGVSIRQVDNMNWERGRLHEPRATFDEMVALAVDNHFRLPKLPEMVEFQATNLCNLKCRMCNPSNSSRIAKDPVHWGWEPDPDFTPINPKIRRLGSIESGVNQLIDDTGSEVRAVRFVGGEPFLLREIPRLLDRLIAARRAPFLSLQFVSNGSVVPRWLALAPRFRNFDLVISVDGYADHYDYIRHLGHWSKLAHHLELYKKLPNTSLLVTTTIQVNNVLNLTQLFRYLDSVDIAFTGYLLDYPNHLAVGILPSSIRHLAAARLAEYAETDCRPEQRGLVMSFASQIKAGSEAGNPDRLRDFMLFTNDLDASRGQSIHRTDPELVELLEQAGHPWLHDTLHAPAANVAEETRRWRRALTEARNATVKLQQEVEATRQVLPDESARSIEMPEPSEVQNPPVTHELEHLRGELAEVYASRSWQVTRPLRAARGMLPRWLRPASSPG